MFIPYSSKWVSFEPSSCITYAMVSIFKSSVCSFSERGASSMLDIGKRCCSFFKVICDECGGLAVCGNSSETAVQSIIGAFVLRIRSIFLGEERGVQVII